MNNYVFNNYETIVLKSPQTVGTAQKRFYKEFTCKMLPIQNEYSNNWKSFSHFSELFDVITGTFSSNSAYLQTFNIHVIV